MATHIDVMISSTSRDLPDHRKEAEQAILKADMYPIEMETLGAKTDSNAVSVSLDMVDKAEVYVGIFGMRYGFVPLDPRNPDDISITEMEYRRAKERGIPVLVFIMDNAHPITVDDVETENPAKLKAFKQHLLDNEIVAFFTSPTDLRAHIIHALKQPDIVSRAAKFAEADPDVEEGRLPDPPELYADPPYILTNEFIGRTKELRQLDAWAKSADPMMLVEAIGGMGKSAVTWQWVNERARDVLELDGIMWWSFYESGATMGAFIRHALAYITQQNPDDLPRDMKANFKQLLHALQRGRYLLVLDGLERVLVAYHRWNAAQMRDDSVEDAESIIKDRDIRTCTHPNDDEILKGLLACTTSKILISTRLIPLALEDGKTHQRSKGVDHLHLNGLHPDDALALVRAAGVTVDNVPIFTEFIKTFGGHSLLVKLVAGRVQEAGSWRGNFDDWYDLEKDTLRISDPDAKQRQSHILKYAFAGLTEQQSRFMSQIAAFGNAVDYDTLQVFNPFVPPAPEPVQNPEDRRFWRSDDAKQEAQEKYDTYLQAQEAYLKSPEYRQATRDFNALVQTLEQRGLLYYSTKNKTYDMHPVVRGYAFEKLEGSNKTATFERIHGHFTAQDPDDIESAKEVADLSNTIAIYRALLGAGKWDDAARFYVNRLRDKLVYNLAAYYTVLELLLPLFPDGTDTLPRLTDASKQSSITTTLANIFYLIGREEEALQLRGVLFKLDLEQKAWGNLCVDLQAYSISLQSDNKLALAQKGYQLALNLANTIDNQHQISMSRLYLLGIYKDTGQWQFADDTHATLQENPPSEVYWQAVVEHWYAESLIYRDLDASAALDKAEKLTITGNNAMMNRQLKGLRGEVALEAGDYAQALRWFEERIQLERKAGSSTVTIPLGGLARTYALMGDREKALEIIANSNFDDDINVAEVYQVLGDTENARKNAISMYKWAWADGAPYSLWWYLKRAKAVLDKVGAPSPEMPPYDESKIGKIPHEDEIRAVIAEKKS